MAICFLTSSPTGPLDGSRPVDGLDRWNGFVDQLQRVWPKYARCLMITASPREYAGNDEMTEYMKQASLKAGLGIACFDLLDGRNAFITREWLFSYDVIWLGGGHVPTQNLFFQELGLRELIEGFPGIVIGISAGTMNSADIVYAQPELPGEASDPEYQRYYKGLNLTKTQILPHYQMVKDFWLDGRALYPDITAKDSFGHRFLILPDGSYLLCEQGRETVFGEAWVMADGEMYPVESGTLYSARN